MNRALFTASLLLVCTIIVVGWQEARHLEAITLTPTLTGKPELCLSCHGDLAEISPSHPVETFGCVICHGGEPLALDADLAHSSLRGGRNPSSFDVVEASCGGSDCHSGDSAEQRDHIQRATTSIQATYAGAIAAVRQSFGVQPDETAHLGIFAIQDEKSKTDPVLTALEAFDPNLESHPSVLAFAENCLNCHLTAEPLPGPEYARLTGCAACHTPTAGRSLDQPIHQLTLSIPYSQCNACHNRGNYSLQDMQFHPRQDEPSSRFEDYYQPIAQFTQCEWTLDCIDCHTRQEAMGDGDLHNSQKEVQNIQCKTCHGTLEKLPQTRTIADPNDLALRLAFLNPVIDLQVGDTILVTEKGESLWNVRQLPNGTYELFGKANGQRFTFKPVQGTACEQASDEQESRYCHECHAVER